MGSMVKLYNSLTKNVEDFKSLHPLSVGMYACGPTVYQFAHIGNFRAYATADLLVRVLQYNDYDVNFVMNITDVGHLVSDADTGEDKLEKSAKKEGKTAWEVAEFYTDAFLKDYQALNLTPPATLCKATDHIKEQIDLIQRIEENGFTYTTPDGIYFDTSLLKDYGKLSSFDKTDAGFTRVDANDQKKNPRDFALWKFSPKSTPDSKRDMEWNSPWGKGFPGWHIECSAMSMKYLGETFDIHTGGVDHKEIHHPNEIAQAESVTHKPLAKYWLHSSFMLVAGQKMSKSLENTYTLYDLEKEGFSALDLRYLYFNAHYRQEMNFTFEALEAGANALKKLRQEIVKWDEAPDEEVEGERSRPEGTVREYEKRFLEAVNDDLNMSKALGVMWELVKSDNPSSAKSTALFKMDRILGLDLKAQSIEMRKEQGVIPGNIQALVEERQQMRKEKRFNAADHIRAQIKRLGYDIEDTVKGVKVRKI